MEYVTAEDMAYLASQSTENINMILAGMTSLMNDTDGKVEALENQKWYQRMARTITGKNKATRTEIQRNGEKLNAYMSEAIAELYNRSCIDERMILSLGNQLNELYAEHIQLKAMLGAFVSKLNEKIESVDNFHILNTEIEQGVYSEGGNIVSICQILGQVDNRMLLDSRKMGIITRSMRNQNILSDSSKTLKGYLLEVANTSMSDIGVLYMELNSLKSNFVAKVMVDVIENYHLLPDMTKMMKSKESVVEKVILDNQLEPSVELALEDIFKVFIDTKEEIITGFVIDENSEENLVDNNMIEDESNTEYCKYSEEEIKEMYKYIKNFKSDYTSEAGKKYSEYKNIFKELRYSENPYVCHYIAKLISERNLCIEREDGIGVISESPYKWWVIAARKGYAPAQFELSVDVLDKIGCQNWETIARCFYDIDYKDCDYDMDNHRILVEVEKWLDEVKKQPEYKLKVEEFLEKEKFIIAMKKRSFG